MNIEYRDTESNPKSSLRKISLLVTSLLLMFGVSVDVPHTAWVASNQEWVFAVHPSTVRVLLDTVIGNVFYTINAYRVVPEEQVTPLILDIEE